MHRNNYGYWSAAVTFKAGSRTEIQTLKLYCCPNTCGARSSSVFFYILFCFVDAAVSLSVCWLWLLARSSYRESSGKRWSWKGEFFFFFLWINPAASLENVLSFWEPPSCLHVSLYMLVHQESCMNSGTNLELTVISWQHARVVCPREHC